MFKRAKKKKEQDSDYYALEENLIKREHDKKNAEELSKKRAECSEGASCLVSKVLSNITHHPERWSISSCITSFVSWDNKQDNINFWFTTEHFRQPTWDKTTTEKHEILEGRLVIKGVCFDICHWDTIKLNVALNIAKDYKLNEDRTRILKEWECE